MSFSFSGPEPKFSSTGPDDDDYRSFLIDFRKLLAPGSPLQFKRVVAAARACYSQDQESLEWFALCEREWNQRLRRGPLGLSHNGRAFRPEELIDLWMNGTVFHEDLKKRQTWDSLNESVPLPMFIISMTVSGLLTVLAGLVARLDWLRGGPGHVTIPGGRRSS